MNWIRWTLIGIAALSIIGIFVCGFVIARRAPLNPYQKRVLTISEVCMFVAMASVIAAVLI